MASVEIDTIKDLRRREATRSVGVSLSSRLLSLRSGLMWQDRLPAGGQSTPMSYGVEGKQYVVTAAGGHGSMGTKLGDYVIAYTLAD